MTTIWSSGCFPSFNCSKCLYICVCYSFSAGGFSLFSFHLLDELEVFSKEILLEVGFGLPCVSFGSIIPVPVHKDVTVVLLEEGFNVVFWFRVGHCKAQIWEM